jgi:hypothetical protein
MKSISLVIVCFLVITGSYAQNVGIGTNNPHSGALLDITSTTKGVLLPRMTTAQRSALSITQGLTVYDTNTNSYWYHNGTAWVNMASGGGVLSSDWVTTGDTTYLSNINGFVGIGTTSPTAPLTINYMGDVPGLIVNSTSTEGGWSAIDIDSKYGDAALRFKRDGLNKWVVRNSGNSSSNNFEIINLDGALAVTRLQIDALTGNVGIGKVAPAEKLDVSGNAKISGNIGIGGAAPTKPITINYGGNTAAIEIKSTTSQSWAAIDIDGYGGDAALRFYHQGVGTWNIRNQAGTDDFQINELNGGGTRFMIENTTGNVGIGNDYPSEKLDVTGNVKISGAVTVGGDGIVKSTNATQMKMTRSSISLGLAGVGAGGTGTTGYLYWTESFNALSIFVGNVQSATATGEWYKIMLTPFEIDTVNKRCRFHFTNVASTTVSFGAIWEVLLVGN